MPIKVDHHDHRRQFEQLTDTSFPRHVPPYQMLSTIIDNMRLHLIRILSRESAQNCHQHA
jgi:hypothetical protein